MQNIQPLETPVSQVTALFAEGSVCSSLLSGATFADLADCLDQGGGGLSERRGRFS
jgi:hypothetical protein